MSQDMQWRQQRSASILAGLNRLTDERPRERVAAQLGENLCDSCHNGRCPVGTRTAISCVEFRGSDDENQTR